MLALAGCAGGSPNSPEAPEDDRQPPSARSVVQGLKSDGLPVGKVVVFNASSDPNDLLGRPNQYIGKAVFRDRRAEDDQLAELNASEGGTVEVFDDEEAARARFEYVEAIGKSGGPFAEYDYIDGRVVLRVSADLTPSQAAEYEAALEKQSE